MKKQHNKYAIIGLKALQRAATKVADDAKRNNYKIPIWKNGRIEYETSEINTEQTTSLDGEQRGRNVRGHDT